MFSRRGPSGSLSMRVSISSIINIQSSWSSLVMPSILGGGRFDVVDWLVPLGLVFDGHRLDTRFGA